MIFCNKVVVGATAAFIIVSTMLSSCYVARAYRFRKFELEDVPKLRAVPLAPAANPFRFAYDTAGHNWLARSLDADLAGTSTYAFMVLRGDTVLYERYFGTVRPWSQLPSFSVAKSVTSTLVSIALHEGYIKNLQQPITDYLPELGKHDERFHSITIQHLLDMRSGVESSENYYNPFSDVLRMGFNNNVNRVARKTGIEKAPGDFDYKSVNTQLLAMVVEKATGRKLQHYAAEKLWGPLGMEHPATWNADRHNTVRAFCCINAAARDYAKFGLLFLNKGRWQGRQLVPAAWVEASVNPDTMRKYDGYKNQWWGGDARTFFSDSITIARFAASRPDATIEFSDKEADSHRFKATYTDGEYHAQGILDQFIYVNPKKRLVIVRLGHDWTKAGSCESFIYGVGDRL